MRVNIKKLIKKTHLWLGLATGIIVFIISITGCLFVFQKEISNIYYQDTLYIAPQSTKTIAVTKLKEIADKTLSAPSTSITIYKEKNRAWEFMVYKSGDEDANTWFGTVKTYKSVFINPYTGAVTGNINYKYNFFIIVEMLHYCLLINRQIGEPIVAYSTLIFVFMLITGIILWWPKNKAAAKQRFWFRWKDTTKFKRKNYDVHNILGFYTMFITLILALTGMIFSIQWFQATVYVIASQSITPPEQIEKLSDTTLVSLKQPLDIALNSAKIKIPDANRYSLILPKKRSDVILISGIRGEEAHYNSDKIQFDQYSGKQLHRSNYENKNNGEKLITMNYDIHTGIILGLPGKILAFLASLVAASLPITGFMIWWGRKKKKTSVK
ncbi:PepSY domain-containing protein [Flavobacterium psychrophilum]